MKSAEEVVKTYENLLYRAALHITGNRDDALDMVQETLIKWITSRPDFASDEHEKAWLLRVVMNLSRNLVGSMAKKSAVELLDLPENLRAVIYLYYYEGYNTTEIAEILQENASTVRTWLSRGRERLRKVLKEEGESIHERL